MGTKSSAIPVLGMTTEQFRRRGKEIIDRIADYYESIEKYRVRPDTAPGYLRLKLPSTAPKEPEPWDSILADFDKLIVPGITHWQSPHFHAYFPAQASFPALIGDMLSGMINAIGFSWIGCPAMTELEVVVMDWLSNALGLPESFRSSSGGGGVIQGTASEAVFVAVLTARHIALNRGSNAVKLTAYLTSQRHASCDKALRLAGVLHIRIVNDADDLEAAINRDVCENLQPFFIGVTIGYTSTAGYDDISAIAAVSSKYSGIHLHVDAAYAGSALICPEFRYMIKGVEHANSFNFNPHKWMLTNFDCSAYFVRDRLVLQNAMSSDMSIYHNEYQDLDLRNWTIPLGRRFRALKIWFVMRAFGVSGLQANIRR